MTNTLSRKFGTSPIKHLITDKNELNLSKIRLECEDIVIVDTQEPKNSNNVGKYLLI